MKIKHTIVVIVILIVTALFSVYIGEVENTHPNKPFSQFPKKIGSWEGSEDRFDQKIYDILGVDDSFLATYHNKKNGAAIQVYIGFYQSQKEGDLIHSPKNCVPGGGWDITKVEKENIRISKTPPKNAKVVKLTIQKGSEKQYMLYWFHSRGRIISSEYAQKIYLVIDSILKRRTDGSFVRLIAPVNGKDDEQALSNMKSFAEALMPVLDEFIPS